MFDPSLDRSRATPWHLPIWADRRHDFANPPSRITNLASVVQETSFPESMLVASSGGPFRNLLPTGCVTAGAVLFFPIPVRRAEWSQAGAFHPCRSLRHRSADLDTVLRFRFFNPEVKIVALAPGLPFIEMEPLLMKTEKRRSRDSFPSWLLAQVLL